VISNLIVRQRGRARTERGGDDSSSAAELAARTSDGFDVALFWDSDSGRLWVDVLHTDTGESFRIAAPPAHALDVFYHPFTYCLAT